MYITAKYDPDASSISEKLTFFCNKFELTREDVLEFKEKKLVTFVKGDDLPDSIPCEILVRLENFKRARIMFFNLSYTLPKEVFDEPFLNRNLIEWSEKYGGFWLEFEFPLKGEDRDLVLSFEI